MRVRERGKRREERRPSGIHPSGDKTNITRRQFHDAFLSLNTFRA